MTSETAESEEYELSVNGVDYCVRLRSLSGAQIRALADLDSRHTLILESGDQSSDSIVLDDDLVAIDQGRKSFFSQPPAVFGSLA